MKWWLNPFALLGVIIGGGAMFLGGVVIATLFTIVALAGVHKPRVRQEIQKMWLTPLEGFNDAKEAII